MATVESPPTIPAVYQAALISKGPPKKARGATTAPMTPSKGKQNTTHYIRNSSGKNTTCQSNFVLQSGNMAQTNPFTRQNTHLIVHLSRRDHNKLATLNSMTFI